MINFAARISAGRRAVDVDHDRPLTMAEVPAAVATAKASNVFWWLLGSGVALAAATSLALSLAATPEAGALPVIPDRVPAAVADGVAGSSALPGVPDAPGQGERDDVVKPQVTVTNADGSPITGPVRRGDVLLVHGTGFDPGANRGGFPVPVPPGVPNGVYVLYSAFPEHWKPSEGAGGEARTHPHDRMAWVMPAGTLEAVPGTGVNMRRQLSRVSQPMADDGSFTARITVDPAEAPPGDNWGVYLYAAAGSVNPDEEIFVPLPYSTEPGPNTPPPASADLLVDASAISRLAKAAGGGVTPKNGAVGVDGGRIGFTLAEESLDPATGHGVVKFRGTADATARFSMVHMVFRDPWIEVTEQGAFLTAEISKGHDVGPDSVQRIRVARILGGAGGAGGSGADGTRAGEGVLHTTIGEIERVR